MPKLVSSQNQTKLIVWPLRLYIAKFRSTVTDTETDSGAELKQRLAIWDKVSAQIWKEDNRY